MMTYLVTTQPSAPGHDRIVPSQCDIGISSPLSGSTRSVPWCREATEPRQCFGEGVPDGSWGDQEGGDLETDRER